MYLEGEDNADLIITVGGADYHAPAVEERTGHGFNDTAVVTTDIGSVEFTDLDHDGHADLMTRCDAAGRVLEQAQFDCVTGEWVHIDPTDHQPSVLVDHSENAAAQMIVCTDEGETDVGPPTIDTDGDGRCDTAIVHKPDGGMVLYTDVDGDGIADKAVEISPAGDVVVAQHTQGNTWVVVERDKLANGFQDHKEDPVYVDPTTNQWVR